MPMLKCYLPLFEWPGKIDDFAGVFKSHRIVLVPDHRQLWISDFHIICAGAFEFEEENVPYSK